MQVLSHPSHLTPRLLHFRALRAGAIVALEHGCFKAGLFSQLTLSPIRVIPACFLQNITISQGLAVISQSTL